MKYTNENVIELLNIDCLEYMKGVPDKFFDLAICDPPYGIGKFWDGGDSKNKGYRNNEPDWNQNIPTRAYFEELKRVSVRQIIWGWNYYVDVLGPTNNLIVWDKHLSYKTNYSEFEIAFYSEKTVARIIKIPIISKVIEGLDYHPCAKPSKLYRVLLRFYANDGDKIFDSHLGSGSIAMACHDMKFDLIGCEIDKDYYDAAVKRFENYKKQLSMF